MSTGTINTGNTAAMNTGKNLFAQISKEFGLLPGARGLNSLQDAMDEATQTPGGSSPLDQTRREAEIIAIDVITSTVGDRDKKPPNKYCKTMRWTVKELSDRHDIVFKGMASQLNLDEKNAFTSFVHVADEIFGDGVQ